MYKRGRKIHLCFTKYIVSSLTWDNAVLCGTEKSHAGQTSLIWDRPVSYREEQNNVGHVTQGRPVSYGTNQSHVGDKSIMQSGLVGQTSLMRDRLSYLGQTSLIWGRAE